MSKRRKRHSGFAVAAISIFGLTAMGAAAAIVVEGGVSEGMAIEDDLIRHRARWAATGQFNYVLSRARQDGICNVICANADLSRANTLLIYVFETYNAKSGKFINKNATERRWQYQEINDEYAIDVFGLAGDGGLTNTDGIVTFQIQYKIKSDLESIKKFADILPLYSATICTSLSDPDDPCPVVVTNSDTSGISRISDFRVIR